VGLAPPEQAASERASVAMSKRRRKRPFLFIEPSIRTNKSDYPADPRRVAATAI
jgi:hypothetical protein